MSIILAVASPLLIIFAPQPITKSTSYAPIQRTVDIRLQIEAVKKAEIAELARIEAVRLADLEAARQVQIIQQQYVAPTPEITVTGCGDNAYANYIYMHESGCRPTATNAGGCYGIGQDCNGVVRSQCGADYACQNRYFTIYCLGRYGSWEAAYSYWTSKNWW